jgi:hypothetical protein
MAEYRNLLLLLQFLKIVQLKKALNYDSCANAMNKVCINTVVVIVFIYRRSSLNERGSVPLTLKPIPAMKNAGRTLINTGTGSEVAV